MNMMKIYLSACPKRTTVYITYYTQPARHLDSLRERDHPFSLPDVSTSTHKKSFVVRTLYKFIYTIIIHSSLYHYICIFVYVCFVMFFCTIVLIELCTVLCVFVTFSNKD